MSDQNAGIPPVPSEAPAPQQPPQVAPPPRPPAPIAAPRKRSPLRWLALVLLGLFGIAGMCFVGLVLLVLFVGWAAAKQPQRSFGEELITGAGPDKVVVIEVKGIILDQSEEGMFGMRESFVERVTKQLRRAGKDPAVKAVVLAVDSPGGGVTASDVLCNEIKKLKAAGKKVIVHMGDLCASGGYYISAPADCIMAGPTTLTGSISVVGHFLDMSVLLEQKLGVKAAVIKTGRYKDIGSPFRPMEPEEQALLKLVLDDFHRRFVDIVTAGRAGHGPLPADVKQAAKTVGELADGRIFTATQALQSGLVDAIGFREDAYEKAKEVARLEQASVVRYRRRGGLVDILVGDIEGRVNVNAGVQIDAGELTRRLTPRFEFRWYPAP